MTQLALYRNSNTSNASSGDSADMITGSDELQYNDVKPCYDVCTNVLGNCPYYLPSSYQRNTSDNGGDNPYVTTEYVYGGYPAFACPGLCEYSIVCHV